MHFTVVNVFLVKACHACLLPERAIIGMDWTASHNSACYDALHEHDASALKRSDLKRTLKTVDSSVYHTIPGPATEYLHGRSWKTSCEGAVTDGYTVYDGKIVSSRVHVYGSLARGGTTSIAKRPPSNLSMVLR